MSTDKAENLPAKPGNTIHSLLMQPAMRKQLEMAIPKHLTVDRLLRVVMTAIRVNPRLMDCTQESLLACVMGCATLGLEPEPFLGQAYLVPYQRSIKVGNQWRKQMEAQLIPGYRGYIALARRSGDVQSVAAQVVYENDRFVLQYGLDERLEHVPAEGERGEVKGAYVVFKYKDGSHSFDYMTRADIDKIRSRSKASENGPWVTDYDEMAKKTVIRRHVKLAPLSVEMARAAAAENLAMAGESQIGLFDDNAKEIPYDIETVDEQPKTFGERLLTEEGTGRIGAFLEAMSKYHGVEVEAIKTQSADTDESWSELMSTYRKWCEKNPEEKAEPEPPITAPPMTVYEELARTDPDGDEMIMALQKCGMTNLPLKVSEKKLVGQAIIDSRMPQREPGEEG